MADSCHLDFLKKDQLFSLAILAYHITSLPKAIYEKKSNVMFRRLKSKCVEAAIKHICVYLETHARKTANHDQIMM